MEDVYGFEVIDNDSSEKNHFMLYLIKNNILKPVIKEFERGINEMFTFEQMIECLKFNKINRLLTYNPNFSETVCSDNDF